MNIVKNIEFLKGESRFSIDVFTDTLLIPKAYSFNTFRWVLSSISHEDLHRLIYELEGYEATKQLDNLGYNIVTGCIEKRVKETIGEL